jgi:hypothetical protein
MGSGHTYRNPGKYRDALARPVEGSSNMETPGNTNSMTKRLKENGDAPVSTTKGNMIIMGIGLVAALYFVFYKG